MPYLVNPTSGTPNAWDYLGAGTGKITDLLLRALLSGQIIPKQAPGTQFSQASPGQGFSMAPTQANALPQTARPQAPRFGGFQLNQVPQQLQQLKLQQAQQQLNPQSPINQFLLAQAGQMNRAGATPTASTAPSSAPSLDAAQLTDLLRRANEDDDEAIAQLEQLGIL